MASRFKRRQDRSAVVFFNLKKKLFKFEIFFIKMKKLARNEKLSKIKNAKNDEIYRVAKN